MDKPEEVLIPLYPKTDFDKRLFAERHIKELRIEIGKLKAHIEELEDHKSTYLAKHAGNDPAWTAEEKKFIRRDEQVARLLDANKKIREKNKRLQITNTQLIAQYHGKRIREIESEKD
jgi:uncharacterized protein (DUF2336 family)